MLRYQLYEMNVDTIPIEKEQRYLQDYIDLQMLRKDEQYSIAFDPSPEVHGFLIEPLLLITFVENAFKHISHHMDKPKFITINMKMINSEFYFEVENTKECIEKPAETNSGIGLGNVKRRLKLLYPGHHQLNIIDQNNIFKIELTLNFNSRSWPLAASL